MSDIAYFHWFRGQKTKWTEAPAVGQNHSQLWLVPDPESAVSSYQPLKDELALFRTFSDTEPTREGIEAFAAAYGVLGASDQLLATESTSQIGESLSLWDREITEMRFAMETWDSRHDEEWLAERIRVEGKDDSLREIQVLVEVYPDGSPLLSEVVSAKQHQEIWPHIKSSPHGTVFEQAALFHVQGAINSRMERFVAPRLLYNPENGQVELHLDPGNLLGAMWLQFARAIEADKEYRRCETCKAWFEVSADGKRRQAKYCSTRCRVKAYRDRRREALLRAEAGDSLSEIARDLGTTVKKQKGS